MTPIEYPYYAVKSPTTGILASTLSDDDVWTIQKFTEVFYKQMPWEDCKQKGYSIVRVAIVEEPK